MATNDEPAKITVRAARRRWWSTVRPWASYISPNIGEGRWFLRKIVGESERKGKAKAHAFSKRWRKKAAQSPAGQNSRNCGNRLIESGRPLCAHSILTECTPPPWLRRALMAGALAGTIVLELRASQGPVFLYYDSATWEQMS